MKRFLNSFLAVMLIASCVNVNAFIPQGDVKYSPDVVELNQDFSGSVTDFTIGTTIEDESYGQAEIAGSKLKVTNPLFNIGSNLDLGKNKTKYILQFSVSTEEDYKTTDTSKTNYSLYWYAPNRGANNSGYGVAIPFESINAGVVRTYQITINESATTATSVFEKVLVKDGDGEYRRIGVTFDALKLPATNCYAEFSPKYLDAGDYNFYLGGKAFAGGSFDWNMPYEKAPVFFFDDIKISTYKLVEGDTHNLTKLDGISYSEDFQDEPISFESTDLDVIRNTEKDGNGYYTLQQNNLDAKFSAWSQGINPLLQPNTTISFDLKCEIEGMPFLIGVGRPSALETIQPGVSISYGTTVTATASFSDNNETATKAEFYVNGQLYTTVTGTNSFGASISGLKIGTNSIFAKMYCESGLIVYGDPRYIKVDYKKDKAFDIGQEYEVDYKYLSGNGRLDINDGCFKLSMSHAGDELTYMTIDGEESYAGIGEGDYKIVVASGYAEIYWNGQFLVSILLPYDTSTANVEHTNISDVAIKSSGVKATLFRSKDGGNVDVDTFPKVPYYSLEFDKKDTSNEEIYINDGLFSTTLYFRNDGVYVRNQQVASAEPTEQKLSDMVKTGYYRLYVGYGVAQLTCNNKIVGNFKCVFEAGRPKLKRTVTNPASSTFIAIKNIDDVYYHNDNFENDTEIPSEDYWQAGPTNYRSAASESIETIRQVEANGNHYMKLDGTGVYVLNASDQYPNIKWRGKANQGSGKVFAILRQALAQQHTKIGYDFDTQSWFFEIMQLEGTMTEEVAETTTKPLRAGKWYDFEVICDGFVVKLLVDGETVLTKEIGYKLDTIHYGRFGIGVQNSSFSFDNFEYKGKNRVTPGASTFVPLQFAGENIDSYGDYTKEIAYSGVSAGAFFKDPADGTVYGVAEANAENIKSTDNGKTWEKANVGPFKEWVRDYATLADGTMVSLVTRQTKYDLPQYSRLSVDGGKTWSSEFKIHDGKYGYIGTGDRFRSTMDGRVFAIFSTGYEGFSRETIFYTDNGVSWHRSDPEFLTQYDIGVVANEGLVIDAPGKDEVWAYFRSDTGFLTYFKSFDNGKTFDTTPYLSGLPSVCSTFTIHRDWNDPNTYYAAFMYDTEPAMLYNSGGPRNRASMAISRDGMKTWEFVSDLVTTNNVPGLHMSDLNMWYFQDGYLYWKINSLQGPGLGHIGVQDVSKIKTVKRLPEYHFRYMLGYEPIGTTAQRQCVISKTKDIAWIYGDYYTTDVKNGGIDVATAEKIFGVSSEVSGTNIVLKLGGGSVTIAPNSAGYLDIKTLCEKFGKTFRETEDSYCILDTAEIVDKYQKAIDNLV